MSLRTERGSIPLTLLVTIVVGGVVAALFTQVVATQRSVTFDREYQAAIAVADAGAQQALTTISALPSPEPVGTTLTSATSATGPEGTSSGDGSFAWTAEKADPTTWEVRATGTVDGVERVIEATVSRDAPFFLAGFADLTLTLIGNNTATSYPSSGFGAIGSNGTVTMNGGTDADFVYLFGGSATCEKPGCSNATEIGNPEPLDLEPFRAQVQQEMDANCAGGFTAWRPSLLKGQPLNGGDVICATDVTWDADLVLSGATQDNPVRFYVTGDVTPAKGGSGNALEINCPGCKGISDPQPESGALRINTLGAAFETGNQSHVAAAVLAPNAGCSGGPSSAGTQFYGSMVCEDIGNNGGWDFHYDERLGQIGVGEYEIEEFREESTGTTSFTP